MNLIVVNKNCKRHCRFQNMELNNPSSGAVTNIFLCGKYKWPDLCQNIIPAQIAITTRNGAGIFFEARIIIDTTVIESDGGLNPFAWMSITAAAAIIPPATAFIPLSDIFTGLIFLTLSHTG